MRRFASPSPGRRLAVAPWFLALLLLLPACELPRVADGLGGRQAGGKTVAAPVSPVTPAPLSPLTTAPEPPLADAEPYSPPAVESAGEPAGEEIATALPAPPFGPAAPTLPVPPLDPAALPRIPVPAATGAGAPIRVALLAPFGGASAKIGEALLNAAQMALFDVADASFALLPIDTKGTPAGAAAAAREAIAAGARLIAGPLYAGSVATVAPIARAGGVPVMALSNDRTVAGDGVYIMGFMPANHIERVVAFARSKGMERFAALAPETDYGRTMVEELRRAAGIHGGLLSRVEYYDPEATDVSEAVRRLADYDRRRQALVQAKEELEGVEEEWANRELERLERLDTLGEVEYDAVLLPEGGERLRAIAPLLLFYDADSGGAHLIGTGQWDDPTIGHEPALVGGWFAAPAPASRARFERRYRKLYGRAPIRIASLGYDAAALAAHLAQHNGGPDFSEAALTSPFGFLGTDGLFRFRADGLIERSLAVLEVRQRGFRVVSPARQMFAAPAPVDANQSRNLIEFGP